MAPCAIAASVRRDNWIGILLLRLRFILGEQRVKRMIFSLVVKHIKSDVVAFTS